MTDATPDDGGSKRVRDGKGKFAEDPEALRRDADAFRMKAKGATYDEIAVALGYYDKSHAHASIKRHIATIVPPAAAEYRQVMDAQLDELMRRAVAVMDSKHFAISHGQIIYEPGTEFGEDGKPLIDDGPVLSAIDRVLKIQQRRAALWGLDAPAQQRIQVQNVRVTVDGADDV